MVDQYVNQEGHLNVGNGHSIYFQDWGNPLGIIFIYLHGGPGHYFDESNKELFDPIKHRVIFFDQRGCGKSTPYAEIRNNTTHDLIEDIEKLTNHLEIKRFNVIGGSWGSTLTLLYAIAHPERIINLIIWGVYLVRQIETDYVNEGIPQYTFPEAWERFIALVPPEKRTNGDTIMKYYAEKINSNDLKIATTYANEWTLWEATLLSISYDKKSLEEDVLASNNVSVAKLETHYFLNKCFVPENYILDSIEKIKHIPCYVVQGRFDMCTPPIGAYALSNLYGKNLTLQWTNAGHLKSDKDNFLALYTIINLFHHVKDH
ncbi:MAG: prolyl aminopeptidase [Candidatus Roizmanbacteria bacterium]